MGQNPDQLEEGFDALFEKNQKMVLAFFIGHGVSREDAKDLLQETFSRVWVNLVDLVPMTADRQKSWILRVAKNLICDLQRRSKVRSTASPGLVEESQRAQFGNIHDQFELSAQIAALDLAIGSLPSERRLILSLSVLAEMTSEEIGKQLEKPAGTIRYELSQSRISLRQKMEQWMREK